MIDAAPMVARCGDLQTIGYANCSCMACEQPMLWGWASLAGYYGLCGLCSIKIEAEMMERPLIKTFWDSFDV